MKKFQDETLHFLSNEIIYINPIQTIFMIKPIVEIWYQQSRNPILIFCFQGAITQSSGSLQNNENVADVIYQSLQVLSDASTSEESYKRISFLYSNHAYVVMKSGRNIQIIHKHINAHSPM